MLLVFYFQDNVLFHWASGEKVGSNTYFVFRTEWEGVMLHTEANASVSVN